MRFSGTFESNSNKEEAGMTTHFLQSPVSLDECADASDVLAFLCKKYEASVQRETTSDGRVVVKLTYKNGEVTVGTGATTKEAVHDLSVRVSGKMSTRSGG